MALISRASADERQRTSRGAMTAVGRFAAASAAALVAYRNRSAASRAAFVPQGGAAAVDQPLRPRSASAMLQRSAAAGTAPKAAAAAVTAVVATAAALFPARARGKRGCSRGLQPLHAVSTEPGIRKAELIRSELVGTTFRLTMQVFGFPDFRSLIDLKEDGDVVFHAGMIAKEPGTWSLGLGDENFGERSDDVYLQFTQPLTQEYIDAFNVPEGVCFWRGRIEIRGGKLKKKVVIENGTVTSKAPSSRKYVREGTWIALLVNEEEADEVRKKNKLAFERAINAPRSESTGFKTPARIAGAERSQRRAFKQAQEAKRVAEAKKRAELKAAKKEEQKLLEAKENQKKLESGSAPDEDPLADK